MLQTVASTLVNFRKGKMRETKSKTKVKKKEKYIVQSKTGGGRMRLTKNG